MKLLIQRVSQASVKIDDQKIASIANGILVFVGFDPSDTAIEITKLTNKLLNYKVFNDTRGRVSLSVIEAQAEVLLVPQVTLAVKTNKGLKPSFSGAADPEKGLELFKVFKEILNVVYILMLLSIRFINNANAISAC